MKVLPRGPRYWTEQRMAGLTDLIAGTLGALQSSPHAQINSSPTEIQREKLVECQDSRMRQHWDRIVCDELGIPDRYQHVAVLIVRWVKELDSDLDCETEVLELHRLLSSEFGFKSKIVALGITKRPQNQLDSEVSNFVLENDGPHRSHLLIVYYTGHGQVNTLDGSEELVIAGTRNPETEKADGNHEPKAVWSQAVRGLRSAEADVLVILDCCFAGNIMKASTEHTRTYEVLAAAGKDMLTPRPGPMSYTRALMESLKDELKENQRRPFATYDLNQRIHRKKSWRAANGAPVLYTIVGNAMTRHICLAPLDKYNKIMNNIPSKYSGALSLRFVFAEKSSLDEKQVGILARNISEAAKDSCLTINAIDWMGFQPHKEPDSFQGTVGALCLAKKLVKRRNQKTEQTKRKRKVNEEIRRCNGQGKRLRLSTIQEDTEHLVNIAPRSGPPTPVATPSSQ